MVRPNASCVMFTLTPYGQRGWLADRHDWKHYLLATSLAGSTKSMLEPEYNKWIVCVVPLVHMLQMTLEWRCCYHLLVIDYNLTYYIGHKKNKGSFALGNDHTDFLCHQYDFWNGLHGYQCYCSHLTTRKNDKKYIVVIKCERNLRWRVGMKTYYLTDFCQKSVWKLKDICLGCVLGDPMALFYIRSKIFLFLCINSLN